jgi:hypothetical protein
MSQEFQPDFHPTDEVQITMGEIFGNTEALRSKFSGPTQPGSPEAFQWWSSTTDDILYLRDAINSSWLPIYDFAAEKILLQDGQVESNDIADDARKGTIVEGEDIAPNSCTIKTPPSFGQSLPFRFDESLPFVEAQSTLWKNVLTSKIYLQGGSGVLHMAANIQQGKSRFIVGSVTSTESGSSGSSYSWLYGAHADLSPLNGWQDITFQLFPNTLQTARLTGLSMRWEI